MLVTIGVNVIVGVSVRGGVRARVGAGVSVAMAVPVEIDAMMADVVALTPAMVCVAIRIGASRIVAYPLDARACPR